MKWRQKRLPGYLGFTRKQMADRAVRMEACVRRRSQPSAGTPAFQRALTKECTACTGVVCQIPEMCLSYLHPSTTRRADLDI